jgi:hypothetical protein
MKLKHQKLIASTKQHIYPLTPFKAQLAGG